MHLEGQHFMLPYTEEDKQAVKKGINLKDKDLEDDIDAILDWYKKQPHLAEALIDRDIIEKILIVSKGSRERTKQRIDNFYKYRAIAPELVQSRISLLTKSEEKIWTFIKQALIPKLYEGKRISVVGFDGDPSTFDTEILFRNAILNADFRLMFDYVFPEIWIVDLNNTGIGHLLRMNPVILQKAVNMYQEGIGLSIHQIHCVNAPIFGHHVLNFMKKFLKQKMIERVIIHDSLESLHNLVPREYLPKDYGGDQPSLEELTDIQNEEFRSEKTRNLMLQYCKLISDESKRPKEKYDEEFIVGSFKKLDLD